MLLRRGTIVQMTSRPAAEQHLSDLARLRRPRSRGQPGPHPGAALSRPVSTAMTCTYGAAEEPAHDADGGREGGLA
jgi:hypothetical protein